MNCANHYDRQASYMCVSCGRALCADCGVDIGGRIYCKECIAKSYEVADGPVLRTAGKTKSKFLLFITSCIMPGVGLMYLGLLKRGLFFLTAFFIAAYFAGSWGLGFLGIAIPILWLTAFFDGFKKLNRMNAGINVPDDISDIKNFAARHKNILVLFLALLLVNWAFSGRSAFFMGFPFFGLFRGVIPFILIAGGIVFLFRRRR